MGKQKWAWKSNNKIEPAERINVVTCKKRKILTQGNWTKWTEKTNELNKGNEHNKIKEMKISENRL
jgi:hypothetical protein